MKIKKRTILDEADLQRLLEEHDISLGATWQQTMIELCNLAASQGFDEVNITILQHLLPITFQRNPCVWAQLSARKIPYPFVRSNKIKGTKRIRFYAGQKDKEPSFIKRVFNELKANRIAKFPKNQIPPYYQRNPYHIVHILRSSPHFFECWVAVWKKDYILFKSN